MTGTRVFDELEIVRTRDGGTLQYEIFFNEDESEAVVFERYRDADAAIEHFPTAVI
jgi:quinol monooxygenase YgiN